MTPAPRRPYPLETTIALLLRPRIKRVYIGGMKGERQKRLKSKQKARPQRPGSRYCAMSSKAQYLASTGADAAKGLKCQFKPARTEWNWVGEVCVPNQLAPGETGTESTPASGIVVDPRSV